MRKSLLCVLFLPILLIGVAPAECTSMSLEKAEFLPLEQVNIRINDVSGWFRPVNVTVLLNGYPVESLVYDAGSGLNVSFILPNGKPENLTLRVIAGDFNKTHMVNTTMLIERVESDETVQNKMLMENLSNLEGSIVDSINSRLDNLTALEQEIHEMLTQVQTRISVFNSSLIAEINGAAFELSQELSTVRGELAALKTDSAAVKTLTLGINDAVHTSNILTQDIQLQVTELQDRVFLALLFSIAAAVASVIAVKRAGRRPPSYTYPPPGSHSSTPFSTSRQTGKKKRDDKEWDMSGDGDVDDKDEAAASENRKIEAPWRKR